MAASVNDASQLRCVNRLCLTLLRTNRGTTFEPPRDASSRTRTRRGEHARSGRVRRRGHGAERRPDASLERFRRPGKRMLRRVHPQEVPHVCARHVARLHCPRGPPARARRGGTERPGRLPPPPRRVRLAPRVRRGGPPLALDVLPGGAPPPRGRCGPAHPGDAGAAPFPEARGGAARRADLPLHDRAPRPGADGGEPGRPPRAGRLPHQGRRRSPRRVGAGAHRAARRGSQAAGTRVRSDECSASARASGSSTGSRR